LTHYVHDCTAQRAHDIPAYRGVPRRTAATAYFHRSSSVLSTVCLFEVRSQSRKNSNDVLNPTVIISRFAVIAFHIVYVCALRWGSLSAHPDRPKRNRGASYF